MSEPVALPDERGAVRTHPVPARLRPYALHVVVLAWAPILLAADGRIHGPGVQAVLGVLTLALLVVCARRVEPSQRLALWLCVPVSAVFEAFGSLVWGGYTYRLHNIPLYVPPGHALVYFFGITLGTLPLVRRYERGFRLGVLGLCTLWTVAGLTVLPLWTHRLDASGALVWPLFAWCVLRSGRGTLFAAIWIAVTDLELAGTWAGDWRWHAVAPWTHLPSGNPPSAIAGGYAVIDGTVALAAPLALAMLVSLARRSRRRTPAPVRASA